MDITTKDGTLLEPMHDQKAAQPHIDLIIESYKDAKRVGLVEKVTNDTGDVFIRFAAANPEIVAEAIDHLSQQDIYQVIKEPGTDLTFLVDPAFIDGNIKPQVSFTYNKVRELQTSTDKLTSDFFSLTAPKGDTAGQRQWTPLKYEKDGAAKEITLLYDYTYNEEMVRAFGLEKDFKDYDFFVMTVLDNLILNNNREVSITKVFKEMGNTKPPATKQLQTLVRSLKKGLSTIMTINDKEVQAAWGNDTSKWHEMVSPVMPIEILTERSSVNGLVTDCIIRINNTSPLFRLARSIDHYTTWKKDVFFLYKGRKTERYYSVLHFLMTQIGWLRNPQSKRSNKITYASLYEHTGDKTTRAKQLSRDMLYRLLDEVFIPAGYVKENGYKEDSKGSPGVKLDVTKNDSIKKLTEK